MFKIFFDHIRIIILFGLVAFLLSVTIYWIDRYFERKFNRQEEVVYQDDECLFGDDDVNIWIKSATVIQSEKSGRLKKLLNNKNK